MSIQANHYPFAQEFITDSSGEIRKVIIDIADYRKLLEALEAEGLYRATIEVPDETSPSFTDALLHPIRSHDAFLNGYAPEDEGLYDDYPTG